MSVFFAMIARRGAFSPESIDAVREIVARALPYPEHEARCETWMGADNRAALLTLTNQPLTPASGRMIVPVTDGAKTMTGMVIAPGINDPWHTESVCRVVSFTNDAVRNLNGTYALVKVVSSPPAIHVFNTTTRREPVYWSEQRDVIIVSNRASAINLVIGGEAAPVYDPVAIATFLPEGAYSNDSSPFWGVQVMPARRRLKVSVSGVQVEAFDGKLPEVETVEPTPAAIDEIVSVLVESALAVQGFPVTVGLSGGRDSRMVAAALKGAGVEFTAETRGTESDPEVIVARMVAESLGIPHQAFMGSEYCPESDSILVDPLLRARTAIQHFDGMVSAWESLTDGPFCREVRAGGEGSTSLRAGNARKVMQDQRINRQLAFRIAMDHHRKFSPLLQADVIGRQESFVDTFLTKTKPVGYLASLLLWEVDARSGRLLGPMINGRTDRLQFQLLMQEQVVKHGLQLGLAEKVDQRVVFHILRRLHPPFEHFPLAKQRYRFEWTESRPGDDAGFRARTPHIAAPGSRGAFDWRHHWTREMYDLFFESILRNNNNRTLVDVIEPKAVETWFADRKGTEPAATDSFFAWALLTASVLVSNDWLRPAGDPNNIRIPLPPA